MYLGVRKCVLIGVVNLADWAASVGVNRHTAYRWFREGTLPVPAVRVNQRTVLVNPGDGDGAAGGVGLYARVSSHDQRTDLDRWPGSVCGLRKPGRRWCGLTLRSDPG